MRTKHRVWTAVLVLAVFLGACSSQPGRAGETGSIEESVIIASGCADISADQLAVLMEDQDVTPVNVHVPCQVELPRTDLFIPYARTTDHLNELPAKAAPIVLYCRSGSMRTVACRQISAQYQTPDPHRPQPEHRGPG